MVARIAAKPTSQVMSDRELQFRARGHRNCPQSHRGFGWI